MHDGHHHEHPPPAPPAGPGHNAPQRPAQWQTPHLPEGAAHRHGPAPEPDLDLVETAFVEAFADAPDPTSFLRLAGIPFLGEGADGARLSLLRVEISHMTDVGTLTPHLGGGHRYDPLPAKMTSARETLAFIYFDGSGPVALSFAEARALKDVTSAR